jgi:glucose-6-phosphate isomerase
MHIWVVQMNSLDESLLNHVLDPGAVDEYIASKKELISKVLTGQYGMSDALGWFTVADNAAEALLDKISDHAEKIRHEADVFVLAGVGGSNRAAQSIIEGLAYNKKNKPQIIYMGNTLSAAEIQEAHENLEGKNVHVNIIAKNFATLEPAIAFRSLRSWMREKYGPAYVDRITLTGSYGNGQLAEIAESNGFSFFEFPLAVGGRFSAFSAVSFFPMAVMGVDIKSFIKGAETCEKLLKSDPLGGIAARYSVIRHLLQKRGFVVEVLSYFEPRLEMLGCWWLQLHGETEGKKAEALLPTLSCFSEDLHAIGQYYQEGGRFLFETFLDFFKPTGAIIPGSTFDDGLSVLEGKSFDHLNPAVSKAVSEAHHEAGIPVLRFKSDKLDEESLGEFMYMQMLSAYFSAAFLDVEPFDQNGVEQYKRNLRRELELVS